MRLLVIGGVAAGLSAASRARRIDPSLEIVVLEKGPDISYGACGLPYYLEGRVRRAAELAVYTPEYFRQERNINVRTGARVVSISHPRREVILGPERVHYDRLVIATGARPRTPPAHAFTLHTLEDAERLKVYLRDQKPKRAVVIGAGYIGLETADALRRNGLAVTVVERGANVLGRADTELTKAVGERLERFRVPLQLNTPMPDLTCYDLAILATGIEPNTELAVEAGVEIGRTGAIRVDEHMETNLPGVYAAGDCAEALHLVTGRPVYIPLGTTANKMGRVAGANAAGRRECFGGVVGTAILNIFGLGVAFSGLSVDQARREGFSPVSARITARSRAGYFGGKPLTVELVADAATSRLLGGSIWGEDGAEGRINVIATALHNRMRVEDVAQLDLAYAPPFATVWDPVLIAAQQLSKMV
ncbi:MAG TPA: FAD-dependent oxidoreductase [Bryobacteraceae bacterium]|jgi:NADPH-dependent 2,4-dienoyl-CoA reductase/sulfur reductase-like enzyme|nr:FAD-dependent oxidoreductase [Bryobacteraceae bacterium]